MIVLRDGEWFTYCRCGRQYASPTLVLGTPRHPCGGGGSVATSGGVAPPLSSKGGDASRASSAWASMTGAGFQIARSSVSLAYEPRPGPTLDNRSHEGRQPGRIIPATLSALTDGDACDNTVVRALAWTRGNAKTSYRQVTYQN
jgi:hypothetical protein